MTYRPLLATLLVTTILAGAPPDASARGWKLLRIAKISKKKRAKEQQQIKERVTSNLAASRLARAANREGKQNLSTRAKPFRHKGSDTVLRGGYTLHAHLGSRPGSFWQAGTHSVHLDTGNKAIKRYMKSAARLRGSKESHADIVKQLSWLITHKGTQSIPSLLKLERAETAKDVRPTGPGGVRKLSDYLRAGVVTNFSGLVLLQLGLQAAGIPSKLATGNAQEAHRGTNRVSMWIEIPNGKGSPTIVTSAHGYISVAKRQMETQTVPGIDMSFTRLRN